MKNLKKVLALALAFAMSLTLFAGAAFTDQASIGADFADDVAMLVQLGVVGGYQDGSFKPQGNITRAETTKLIYVLKYGYDDAGKLFAGAPSIFTDVQNNANVTWAKGYINYCYNQGIVGGIGNNKFNPNGNVTVAELSKMLLVSLGADAAKEGYGGSNWAANVVADAMEFGVFDGWTGDPTLPATRELACKLMRNTIFAPIYTYSAITGTGSQYDINNRKNQTLGEKTMGLKHVNGIVAANGRYALTRDEDGMLLSLNGVASNVKADQSTIVYEVTNEYGAVTGMETVEIDVDLSDDLLGNLVDVYFKADGTAGNYSNIKIVGEVLVSNKTVAHDVMAADIEVLPDGESTSSKEVKPTLQFTTADGKTEVINPRAYYGSDETADSTYTSARVKNNIDYKGAAFADRIYVIDSAAETLTQPEYDALGSDNNPDLVSGTATAVRNAVNDMGENELRNYRFVSVDGGATYSYIFAMERMDVAKVSTYNDYNINVSGYGTLDLEDEAVVNGTVARGDKVITYKKDGKVFVEPTETITGKATNFRDSTATINGAIYRAAVAELGDEIDVYFTTSGKGLNKNNDNTQYLTYKNYILEVDGTAVAGAANDYAVVLMSKYDTDTGVVTVRLGFADNTEGTYEVSKINNNEDTNEDAKWAFINNRMVGAVLRVTIANGMANLSANDYEEDIVPKYNGQAGAVQQASAIKSISDYKMGSLRADENSIVYMIYGGEAVYYADDEETPDVDESEIIKNYTALKAKAFKLSNVYEKTSAPVYVKIGDENSAGSFAQWYLGDAVKNTSSGSLSTLVAGSMSVTSAGAGIGETDNLAYVLKAKTNYNPATQKWYLDIAMITKDAAIVTRSVDEVTDADGNMIITGSLESPNKHAIAPGAIVAYEMTASEDEADTNEWVLSIGEVDADFDNYVDDESKDWDNDAEAYTEGVYRVQIGIEDDQFIGFFPYSHSQTGEDDDDWADKLVVVEKDKYNFATIAIDDTNFIEGGDIETISDSDVVDSGDYNAIIVVDAEGEITRVFSLYNRI